MSGLFKSKKQTPEYTTVYDPFSDVRKSSSDWLKTQIGQNAKPYEGQLVAPMSEQEGKSFDFLRKFTDSPAPESLNMANEELRKTMQGEYDPTTSPYYQSVKAESARNLQGTLSDIESDAAGGGRYWSGARLGEQREARTDVGNALNTLLGSMAETERGRRFEAIPLAMQLGQYEQGLPLRQATALQSLGSLPRELSQAGNEAAYSEWLRQNEYPLQIAQLASPYATQQPVMAQTGYAPSLWDKISPVLSQATQLLGAGFNKSKAPSTIGKPTSSYSGMDMFG